MLRLVFSAYSNEISVIRLKSDNLEKKWYKYASRFVFSEEKRFGKCFKTDLTKLHYADLIGNNYFIIIYPIRYVYER